MIEFVKNWWYLLLVCLIPLSIGAYKAFYAQTQGSDKNELGIVLGVLLLSGLILPLIYYEELSSLLSEDLVALIYFLYLGALLVASYKVPDRSFIFRFFSEVTYIMFVPTTNKSPLIWGLILIILSSIFYLVKLFG